jgi:hypothetical protein
MHFREVAKLLEPAKLTFACSAHYLDHIDGMNLTPEQIEFMTGIDDPLFKQSVRDFMVNQIFRRDYWVKGARNLTLQDQHDQFLTQRFVMTVYRPDVGLVVDSSHLKTNLNEATYVPILNLMGDYQIRRASEIIERVKQFGLSYLQVKEALLILSGMGVLSPAQEENIVDKSKKTSSNLNKRLMLNSRNSSDVVCLSSTVLGGGFMVSRIEQLFLFSIGNGKSQVKELSDGVWEILKNQGQRLVKNGVTLNSDAENLDELSSQAQKFLEKRLPIFNALLIE